MRLTNSQNKLNFVLIDDDLIQLFLITKTLNDHFSESEVVSFSIPEDAIAHFYGLNESDFENKIIFLDLNMPKMNGWEVLDNLQEKYGDNLPANARLYILSSSDLPEDILKSKDYSIVSGFYSKPLDKSKIDEITGNSAF